MTERIRAADGYRARGDNHRAAHVLRAALEDDPHNPDLLTHYARVLVDLGDYQGAAEAAYGALTAAPTDEGAMLQYVEVLQRQGRVAEAFQMAFTTAKTHPESGLAQYHYARVLQEFGYHNEALTVVDRALQLNPVSANHWELRGDICRSKWGPKTAEPHYQEALRLEPNSDTAVFKLAVCQLRWGTMSQALNGSLRAQQLNPTLSEGATRNIAMVLNRVLWVGYALVAPLALVLIVAMICYEQAWSQAVPRAGIAVLTVLVAAVAAWVFWKVPGAVLRRVLRTYPPLAVRLTFMALAVIAGAVVAAMGATSVTYLFGPLLCVGAIIVRRLGFLRLE